MVSWPVGVGTDVLHLVSTLDNVRQAKVTAEKLHYKQRAVVWRMIVLIVETWVERQTSEGRRIVRR